MKDTAKHVKFEEESSAVEKGMGRVAAGVETVEEAAAMAGSKIASYVPGTAEHAIRKGKKELEATGDIHVADEIAFEKGPASGGGGSGTALPPDASHTADDLDFVKHGPTAAQNNVSSVPETAMRTADDLAFTRGGGGATVSHPQPQPHGLDPHTADEAAFGQMGGVGAAKSATASEVLAASRGPADKLHTADDLAFGGFGR